MSLADLKPGQSTVVLGFDNKVNLRRRLQDLGIVEGTKIECVAKSPLGDPLAFNIRHATIAIRKCDAKGVLVSGEN